MNGSVHLITDYERISADFSSADVFQMSQLITMGTSLFRQSDGFVGCMRKVEVASMRVDPRSVIGSENQIGDIALDNCQFVDPCERPNICGHGGKCSVVNGKVNCDCTNTGYIGNHCHFGKFRLLPERIPESESFGSSSIVLGPWTCIKKRTNASNYPYSQSSTMPCKSPCIKSLLQRLLII